MRNAGPWIALVSCTALGVLAVKCPSPPAGPPSAVVDADRPDESESESDARSGRGRPDAELRDPASNEEPARTPVAASNGAVVRGRCVAAESRAPLPGVIVTLFAGPARDARELLARRDLERETGDDGRFAFRLHPPADVRLSLAITPARRASMLGTLRGLEDGTTLDFGDIAVPTGSLVRGSVVDETGATLAGALVHFEVGSPHRSAGLTSTRTQRTRTDLDGSFALDDALVPGEWRIAVADRTVARPRSRSYLARAGVVADHVHVVVDARDPRRTITGRVVDASGAPVGGVTVAVPGTTTEATSSRRGVFRLEHGPARPGEPATLVVHDPRGATLVDGPASVRWGSSRLQLIVRFPPRGPVTVVITEARGAPAVGSTVLCHPQDAASRADDPIAIGISGPTGRVLLDDVPEGDYVLTAFPGRDGRRVGPQRVRFRHRARGSTVRVALPTIVEMTVTVVDRSGRPVVGAFVSMSDPAERPGRGSWPRALAARPTLVRVGGKPLIVELPPGPFAATDGDGCARLRCWPGTFRLEVSATERYAPFADPAVHVIDEPRTLRVVVDRR